LSQELPEGHICPKAKNTFARRAKTFSASHNHQPKGQKCLHSCYIQYTLLNGNILVSKRQEDFAAQRAAKSSSNGNIFLPKGQEGYQQSATFTCAESKNVFIFTIFSIPQLFQKSYIAQNQFTHPPHVYHLGICEVNRLTKLGETDNRTATKQPNFLKLKIYHFSGELSFQ
jgi:hypothetical protein